MRNSAEFSYTKAPKTVYYNVNYYLHRVGVVEVARSNRVTQTSVSVHKGTHIFLFIRRFSMKCKVCGSESGKYPLCRVCNIKKEKGEIVKCNKCNNWHSVTAPCVRLNLNSNSNAFVYDAKKVLISHSEQEYFKVIENSLPINYHAFPQVNLASFITKNDDSAFHNELFRNVDFLITDEKYKPLFIIEINDQTHLNQDRKERDEKVQSICDEAGIPIVKFWTSYGVNADYIKKKIDETISSLPIERIHHFTQNQKKQVAPATASPKPQYQQTYTHNKRSSGGCYVATCVYGSYDCPEVWTLRRFRDEKLAPTWYGRAFIRIYYSLSPLAVKLFGKFKWFHRVFKPRLDKLVAKLNIQGVGNTPYNDKQW